MNTAKRKALGEIYHNKWLKEERYIKIQQN